MHYHLSISLQHFAIQFYLLVEKVQTQTQVQTTTFKEYPRLQQSACDAMAIVKLTPALQEAIVGQWMMPESSAWK